MKVKELIQQLQACDQEAEVLGFNHVGDTYSAAIVPAPGVSVQVLKEDIDADDDDIYDKIRNYGYSGLKWIADAPELKKGMVVIL